MTLVALLLVDRAGRRVLLLVSLAGMALNAATLAVFHLNSQQPTWLALVALVAYIVFFSLGLGATLCRKQTYVWLQPIYIGLQPRSYRVAASWTVPSQCRTPPKFGQNSAKVCCFRRPQAPASLGEPAACFRNRRHPLAPDGRDLPRARACPQHLGRHGNQLDVLLRGH